MNHKEEVLDKGKGVVLTISKALSILSLFALFLAVVSYVVGVYGATQKRVDDFQHVVEWQHAFGLDREQLFELLSKDLADNETVHSAATRKWIFLEPDEKAVLSLLTKSTWINPFKEYMVRDSELERLGVNEQGLAHRFRLGEGLSQVRYVRLADFIDNHSLRKEMLLSSAYASEEIFRHRKEFSCHPVPSIFDKWCKADEAFLKKLVTQARSPLIRVSALSKLELSADELLTVFNKSQNIVVKRYCIKRLDALTGQGTRDYAWQAFLVHKTYRENKSRYSRFAERFAFAEDVSSISEYRKPFGFIKLFAEPTFVLLVIFFFSANIWALIILAASKHKLFYLQYLNFILLGWVLLCSKYVFFSCYPYLAGASPLTVLSAGVETSIVVFLIAWGVTGLIIFGVTHELPLGIPVYRVKIHSPKLHEFLMDRYLLWIPYLAAIVYNWTFFKKIFFEW